MGERITIGIGGKYTAGDAFGKLDKNVRESGKKIEDFSDGGKKAFEGLSGILETRFAKASEAGFSVLLEAARGGIWGAIGEAINRMVTIAGKYFEELKHRAEVTAKAIRDAFGGLTDEFGETYTNTHEQLAKQIESLKTNQLSKESFNAFNANQAIEEINSKAVRETAQMATQAGKDLVEMQRRLEVECANLAMAYSNASDMVETNRQILDIAQKDEAAALEYQTDMRMTYNAEMERINDKIMKGEIEGVENIGQLNNLLANAARPITDLIKGGMAASEAMKYHSEVTAQLALVKDRAGDDIEAYIKVQQAEKEAGEKVLEAQQKRKVAEESYNASLDGQTKAQDELTAANRRRKEALDNSTDVLMADENERHRLAQEEITLKRETVEKEKEAAGEKGKAVEAEKKKIAQNRKDAQTTPRGGGGNANPGPQQWDGRDFGRFQRDARNAERQIRNECTAARRDVDSMVKYLKGDMSEAQAKEWEDYWKSIPEHMRDEIDKKAYQNQMLSDKQRQRQQRRFNDLEKKRHAGGKKTPEEWLEKISNSLDEGLGVK